MPKRRPEHQPQRTCAVCREVHPKRSMTRVVRAAGGSVALDPSGKAAGRGTYICDDPDCRDPRRLADAVGRALAAPVEPGTLQLEVPNATP